MPPARHSSARHAVLVFLGVCFALGCLWRFSTLHEQFGFHTLVGWGAMVRGHPWTPAGVVAAYMVGGLLFFVHVLLLWATVFTFDPLHAFLYCELGSLASALTLYGLGRVLRKDVVRRFAGSYMEEVSRALARRGVVTLVVLHLFPICPFSVLNLLAGATHIGFKDYVIGTVVGITPGLILICLFGDRLRQILHHPHWPHILALTLFVMIGLTIFRKARQRFLTQTLES